LVEGVNLVTDHSPARGDPTRLDALAAELVAARPDVLSHRGWPHGVSERDDDHPDRVRRRGRSPPVVASLAQPGAI
jgi:hypothetical protein